MVFKSELYNILKKYIVSGKSFSDFCISLGKNTWWESASWVWRRGTNYYQSNSVARSSDHCRDKWTNGDGHNHNTRLAVLHDEIDYADSNLLKFTLFITNAQRHTWMHLHWHSKQWEHNVNAFILVVLLVVVVFLI